MAAVTTEQLSKKSPVTSCPRCGVQFPLSGDALLAAGGVVRCGACRMVFSALDQAVFERHDPPVLKTPVGEAEPLPAALQQPEKSRYGVLWGVAALVLILAAAGQGAWLTRDSLMERPLTRAGAVWACQLLGCEMAPRRDPARIQVLNRQLSQHPQQPGALVFDLVMRNGANFAQPYPWLRLEVFDEQGQRLGRRVFAPQEYMPQGQAKADFIPTASRRVHLELLDPKPGASGFEIQFL